MNARIIHNTLSKRSRFMQSHPPQYASDGLDLAFGQCDIADNCFGLAGMLNREGGPVSAFGSYVAKFGFFLDDEKGEVVGLSVQGQHATTRKERSNYARLESLLKVDPRAYLLRELMPLFFAEGYRKIKILKSTENPMTLENHPHFTGKYERAVIQAGISVQEDVYLVKPLS